MTVAPTGFNVAPQGAIAAQSGFVVAPTGLNVQPQGKAYGPVGQVLTDMPKPGQQ